jgi:hypothetical protein
MSSRSPRLFATNVSEILAAEGLEGSTQDLAPNT